MTIPQIEHLTSHTLHRLNRRVWSSWRGLILLLTWRLRSRWTHMTLDMKEVCLASTVRQGICDIFQPTSLSLYHFVICSLLLPTQVVWLQHCRASSAASWWSAWTQICYTHCMNRKRCVCVLSLVCHSCCWDDSFALPSPSLLMRSSTTELRTDTHPNPIHFVVSSPLLPSCTMASQVACSTSWRLKMDTTASSSSRT